MDGRTLLCIRPAMEPVAVVERSLAILVEPGGRRGAHPESFGVEG
jgi:hypothetical protein